MKIRKVAIKKGSEFKAAEQFIDILMHAGLVEYIDDVGLEFKTITKIYIVFAEEDE